MLRSSVRLRSVLSILLAVSVSACYSWVRPPADPIDPVDVFMIEDGLHFGVILPDGKGQMVEFAYGEWAYYVDGEDAWYRLLPVLLWKTAGTIGRRSLPCATEAELRRHLHWVNIRALAVPRAKVDALRTRLDARFDRGDANRAAFNRYNFVPDDTGYWMFWNCSDEAAAWLAQLGCAVELATIRCGLEFTAEDASLDSRDAAQTEASQND